MAAVITNRTAVFQGMRVIALLCVMFLHAGHPIVSIGCPITFFFVISGFLYKDKPGNYGGYIWNKCKKLFPVFWLTFAIDFFLNHRVLSWKMIPHLFLVQTYVPTSEAGVAEPFYYEYVGVSWFISCLLFCYILSPFIYRLIERLSKEGMLLLLLCVITLMCTLFYLPIPAAYEKWFLYVSPYFRLLEYVMGMLLARILANTTSSITSRKLEAIGIVLLVAYYELGVFLRLDYWIWALPNLVIIGYLYMYESPILSKVLGNKVMIRSAAYIMPIYLLHDGVMEFVHSQGAGWVWCMIWALVVCVPYAIVVEFVLGKLQKKKG